MGLCGSQNCNCAIQSDSLDITGSGTANSPWQIELAGNAFLGDFYNFASAAQRTTNLASPAEGDLSYLRDVNLFQYWDGTEWVDATGDVQAFSPTLQGSTSNPNLGSTGSTIGWYSRVGDLVYYQFIITFGGTGIGQGSGTYQITLPVAPKAISGSSVVPRGWATINDSGTGQRHFFAIIGTFIELRSPSIGSYAATASITDATDGITFAAGDSIAGQIVYHAA